MFFIAPLHLLVVIVLLFFLHHGSDISLVMSDIVTRFVKEGTPIALMALGGGLVIAAGSVDLSIAGTATLSGIVFALSTQSGLSIPVAVALALLTSALVGALLAGLVTKAKAPALIVSWALGTLCIISSIAIAGSGRFDGAISGLSLGFFTPAGIWRIGGFGFLAALLSLFVAFLVMWFFNLPGYCRALGGSEKGTVYAGLSPKLILGSAFIVNALFAGIAGLLFTLLANSAVTTDYLGRELTAIAVAVFGGTLLTGGTFNQWSVLAAAFFWAGAKTLIDGLDLSFVGSLQQHAADAMFALVFVIVLLLFGRRFRSAKVGIRVIQREGDG